MMMIEKIRNSKKIQIVLIVVFAILAAISLLQGCKNAIEVSQDFQWDAAKAFTLKINPYIESLSPTGALDAYDFETYYLQMEANQFPSLLMLLIPYTFLPPLIARYAWLVSNLCFTGMIIWLLRKTFLKDIQLRPFCLLILFMISGTPYRNQLGVGQHTLFSFMFFLIAVYACQKNEERKDPKKFKLSIAAALAVSYFKYTLTAPLALYFLYKKRWREFVASILVHVIMTFFAAFWLGTSVIDMIILPLKVSSALAGEGGIDLGALFGGSPISYGLAVVMMCLLLWIVCKMPKGEDMMIFSLLTLVSLIITYHRTYDFWV
ncbi:MAG: DUF2029 domain-containing protein, partial [Clostridia bacterium]|nr:DUF2029 domain-containing protein [Clostridia bacterium]